MLRRFKYLFWMTGQKSARTLQHIFNWTRYFVEESGDVTESLEGGDFSPGPNL